MRVKNQKFALPNRTIIIWASKSGGFRDNREGWQAWGLEAAYDVHLRLIGKCIEDFLVVFTRRFRFVTINTFERWMDGRTDVSLMAVPRLHSY